MTPWYAPPLSAEDTPCTGGADDYIALLTEKILPEVKSRIAGVPEFTGISGYSLAGLFAVYAMYRTDVFDRAASMSGSLWFPEITAYCKQHEIKRIPDRMYLSLGDLPADEKPRPLVYTPPGAGLSVKERYSEYGAGAWTPSEAAGAPETIASSPDDSGKQTFPREDLLGLDKKEDRK